MAQPYRAPCDRAMIETQPCPDELGESFTSQQRRGVLAACILTSSMAFIDGSALTVALPALRADLGAQLAALQWVISGYVLALAALTLIGGAMADRYGKAKILTLGAIVFAMASIACAVAPNTGVLIVARVVQGVGAALMTPASLALIGAVYPKRLRNGAIGAWAAASALTTAGGPVVGGWLTETFGWQAVFWINPPLALVAVLLLARFAPPLPRTPRKFDITGALMIAASLGLLAYGLSTIGGGDGELRTLGDDGANGPTALTPVLSLLAGGIALLAFGLWERRTDHPMTPPRIFADRAFAGLNAATMTIYIGLSIMFFVAPFDLIDRRGLSATQAGLVFLPFTLSLGVLSRAFGQWADRHGPLTLLIAGPMLAAGSFAWLALGQDSGLMGGVILPMTLLGLAFAMFVAPLTAQVMSSLDDDDEGLASGVNNAVARMAQLVGVAAAAALAVNYSAAAGYGLAAALALMSAAIIAYALVPSSRLDRSI